MSLSKKELKNFLYPHIGTKENPDSAARLSCALLATYAGCGKKIIEAYYLLAELIQMNYVEMHGSRYTLSALALRHLGIEKQTKSPDPLVKPVIHAYRDLMFERFKWDPAKAWNRNKWTRAGAAALRILEVARVSPHLPADSTADQVFDYIKRVLRAMVYSEDRDYTYFASKAWDIWILADSFNNYVFRMRSRLPKSQENTKPATTGERKLG